MSHHKRHKPNPKHDDYSVRDSWCRAGRAAIMQEKKLPPERETRLEIQEYTG